MLYVCFYIIHLYRDICNSVFMCILALIILLYYVFTPLHFPLVIQMRISTGAKCQFEYYIVRLQLSTTTTGDIC